MDKFNVVTGSKGVGDERLLHSVRLRQPGAPSDARLIAEDWLSP